MMTPVAAVAALATAGLLALPLLGTPPAGARVDARPAPSVERLAAPALSVKPVATGLSNPWDVQPLGGGRLLVTERGGRLSLWKSGRGRTVPLPQGLVWAEGETGLMSLTVDRGFRSTGRIFACLGANTPGGHDVRVMSWRLDVASASLSQEKVLLSGLPSTSGRHGGCRLLLDDAGSLLVGTGDAAVGTNPRDLASLGGKVLRLDPRTGAPWPTNPFVDSQVAASRYVFTYGHRNVQGLAQRRDGTLWSAEHGPDRDDEVNLLRRGGDYGWNPVPGYDESVPMTDRSLPGRQRAARWRSGVPTIATSGATFLEGRRWGAWSGMLAVAALKGERVVLMRFDDRGRLRTTRTPRALRAYGRLRSLTQTPRGDLLVTTGNGSGDQVLRVRPRR